MQAKYETSGVFRIPALGTNSNTDRTGKNRVD